MVYDGYNRLFRIGVQGKGKGKKEIRERKRKGGEGWGWGRQRREGIYKAYMFDEMDEIKFSFVPAKMPHPLILSS